jgi:hypothetical protein
LQLLGLHHLETDVDRARSTAGGDRAAVLPSATAEAGQVLRFVGAGGTGLTPFTFSWQVFAAGAPATPLSTLAGATPYFDTTGLAPGSYTAVLQIQNSAGITLSTPVPFTLTAGKATSFFTVAPCRIVDTRNGAPLANSGPALLVNVVTAPCGIPANARAVAANVTAVASGGTGILALYPGNYPPPPTITVSFATGETRANSAVLALATDGTGTVAALATTSGGSVDLVLDVSGYFAAID